MEASLPVNVLSFREALESPWAPIPFVPAGLIEVGQGAMPMGARQAQEASVALVSSHSQARSQGDDRHRIHPPPGHHAGESHAETPDRSDLQSARYTGYPTRIHGDRIKIRRSSRDIPV